MSDSFDGAKWALVEALLPLCPYLEVFIPHADCMLPDSIMGLERIVFRIGRDPSIMGMPDLVLDDKGWGATIVMKGTRSYVSVPWAAVIAVRCDSADGAQLGASFSMGQAPVAAPKPAPQRQGKRPSALRQRSTFTLIKGGKDE